jgi:hypothetical protein
MEESDERPEKEKGDITEYGERLGELGRLGLEPVLSRLVSRLEKEQKQLPRTAIIKTQVNRVPVMARTSMRLTFAAPSVSMGDH